MRQTVTIDIINHNAMRLLQDLELLKLIRLHTEKPIIKSENTALHKGLMTKQPIRGARKST